MKISLCMILKNEAKTIKRAIESVLPVVDEIIIGIDNKTTDETNKELNFVRSYDVKHQIHKFDFKDDFAAIRNHYIEKCTGDYVLILDGHEYLTEQSLVYLKEFKERNDISLDVVDFNILMGENSTTIFQQPRMFKPFIRYEFAIHNTITHLDNRSAMPQIIVVHDQPIERYYERKKQRSKMNTKGLIEKCKDGDARSMFYLATQYYELSQYRNALGWFNKYLEESDFESEMYQARLYMASCYKRLKRPVSLQLAILFQCFNENVPRNEHLIAIGNIYYDQENYRAARYYYRLATAVKRPDRFLILELNYYTWLPWLKLMMASMMLEDMDTTFEAIKMGKQLAPEKQEFIEAEQKIKQKFFSVHEKKKGSIYVVDSIQSFIIPILKELENDYAIRLDNKFNPENAKLADIIWCDWADENAIAVSHYNGSQKKILRVHSYEVYGDLINNINFDAFDHIIFVARHVFDYLNKRLNFIKPDITFVDTNKYLIIPNGVDLDKFTIAKNKKVNNKIAWAGYLRQTKGVQLLLQLAHACPDYEFHIAGTFQEPDLQNYFNHLKPSNIKLYPWQEDLNKFFKDKTYILSTSIREGCPVAILEGMAAGLNPLIHNWPGSEQLFKYFNTGFFNDVINFKYTLGRYKNHIDFKIMRNHIKENFDQKTQLENIKQLIDKQVEEIHNEKINVQGHKRAS